MRKLLLVIFIMLVFGLLWSGNPAQKAAYNDANRQVKSTITVRDQLRDPPQFIVSVPPNNLLTSYYDYMIGSYNSLPLRVNPNAFGGYFLTFHGKRNLTKRVFYAYIGNSGDIQVMNELTSVQTNEEFPSVAIDPAEGNPLYVWQANTDDNTDQCLEVQATWDAFFDGVFGLIWDPFVVINNPVSITPTTNNEFINPIVQIGPSPLTGHRRAYILGKNSVSHTTGVCENPYIAYTDFTTEMAQSGENTFVWNYISIPQMNQWNNDVTTWRQPFYSFCVGNDGKIYVVGYHSNDLLDLPFTAPDLDVFVCDNYGQGTWQYYSHSSHIPAYNPHINNGNGPGYFMDANETPYADNEMFLKISNSSHMNAVVDENGIVHMIGLWGLGYQTGNFTSDINTVKEMTFNSNTHAFGIREIYPQAFNSSDEFYWLPWDHNADGVTDSYETNTGMPNITTDWNYPYWDETAHDNTMIAKYNNLKITEPNEQGWMAAVWQNSWKARQLNAFDNGEYLAYADVPEIYISLSYNYGQNWSEPIIINSINTPALAGMCPMWVYPADKIKYIAQGTYGKLGLLFYDDHSWGSGSLTPPVGANDGGVVMFMEIQIECLLPHQSGVQGYVRTLTNEAIAEAIVTAGNETTTTSSDGMYCIDLLPGEYSITVHANGYGTQTYDNIIVPYNSYVFQDYNLVPYGIAGYVRSISNNNAVENALVSAGSIQATTNVFGMYYLNLPPGTYNLVTAAAHYTTQNVNNVELSPNAVVYQDFYLVEQRYSITGQVVAGNELVPLSDATVTLFGGGVTVTCMTNSTGGFEFGSLAGNHAYRITVMKDAFDIYSLVTVVYYTDIELPQIVIYPYLGMPVDVVATLINNNDILHLDWSPPGISENRNLINYSVWRMEETQMGNPDYWTFLNYTPGTTTHFDDILWNNLPAATFVYAVKAIYSGVIYSEAAFSNPVIHMPNSDVVEVPTVTRLTACAPNPFTNITQINYDLKSAGKVKIDIYNLAGQHVCTLLDAPAKAGSNIVNWNGKDTGGKSLPSGMYLCKLVAGKTVSTLKLVLMK